MSLSLNDTKILIMTLQNSHYDLLVARDNLVNLAKADLAIPPTLDLTNTSVVDNIKICVGCIEDIQRVMLDFKSNISLAKDYVQKDAIG